ncbi:uncharacterized protein [Choristoneura fumiferana]|uniref:uncharacterized protein n=1 Tax=Choristoneura fumiferana TaxID=7141 RepID=UPI003D153864
MYLRITNKEIRFFVAVNIVEAVKPKSVNLALETVLQFDKKDQSADVEVLNRVQNFLDNIKNVMTSSKSIRRRSNTKDLKFTDFLLEAAEVLNSYDDNDLEDFFAVLDDQSRKYHYKGCKFYELVENNDIRRYMSNKLEQAKDTSAKTMRRYLKDVVQVIATENYRRHAGLVNLVNSLYDGAGDKFDNVVKNLRSYKMRPKESTMSLDDIVSNGVRNLVFDHYSNLNDNARQHLKTEIGNYWLSSQYNGDNHNKDHHDNDNDFQEVLDYKSKLRVIDIPSIFKNRNINDKIKIKGGIGSLLYKKDKRLKSRKPTPKMDIDFIDFKKTTRDKTVATSEEDNTKSDKNEYGFTQGLINEDSNSYELKKPTNRKKSDEAITPTKSSDDERGFRRSWDSYRWTEIQGMHYRAEFTPKTPKRKGKDIAADNSDDFNRQKSTKKLKDRQKSHHKSSNKTKNKKKTTVSDAAEETTLKASKVKESKDSAFASSDEGITIETFENSKGTENKYSNLRKANKPTTVSNNNVHKRIHNLEKEMEDVKERMKLVLSDKASNNEADVQTNSKGRTTEKEIDGIGEIVQTDAKVKNDKTFEIRVYSGGLNNSDTKTTKTITKRDKTTTLEYQTDGETKPSRTTMQKTNDEIKSNRNPMFRSDLALDNRKNLESNEKHTFIISTIKHHETTKALKEHKTAKTDILNVTTLNSRTDSIFKNSVETVTALGYDEQKNGKDNVISTMADEESKITTSAKKETEKDNAQTITTVVDLTKHLKDSDTVVVNVKENGENNMKMTENTNEIDDLDFPKIPFFQNDKMDDPLNDVNVDLDI